MFPDNIIPWSPNDTQNLNLEDFEEVVKCSPAIEILLLGSGTIAGYLPSKLREQLNERGIVLESMDTGAACRTFNVLLGEERRIAAALILVD